MEAHATVHQHEAPTGFIWKYIFSQDHKVIGIQYLLLAMAAVVVGMILSVFMRLRLTWDSGKEVRLAWVSFHLVGAGGSKDFPD